MTLRGLVSKVWDSGVLLAVGIFALVYTVLPRVTGPMKARNYTVPEHDMVAPIVANAQVASSEFHLRDTHKPMLLDFWATWCGPCKLQAPAVDKVYAAYKGRGLLAYGVNASDDADEIREHVLKHELHVPMVLDKDGALSRAFRVGSIPTLVLIDATGKVRAVHTGVTSQSALAAEVESMLSQ